MLLPNLPTMTFGGKTFWKTIDSKNGWILQQNIFSGHFRILDPQKIRQAWGYDWQEINITFKKFTRYTHQID